MVALGVVIGRVVIQDVRPRTPTGAFPAKAAVGEPVVVSADVFRDGHDVLGARADWRQHATLARTRPEIVFENLSPDDLRAVRQALNGRGRWFGDIQFEPT